MICLISCFQRLAGLRHAKLADAEIGNQRGKEDEQKHRHFAERGVEGVVLVITGAMGIAT